MKPHQTPAADAFQTRFNISNCLIANEGRSPPLPVQQEGHGAAPSETLGESNSFCSPFLRHKVILEPQPSGFAVTSASPLGPAGSTIYLCGRAAQGWTVSVQSNGQKWNSGGGVISC